MDFSIGLNFITGVMLGLEFVTDEEDKYLVVDLLILRLTVGLHPIE
jgi:hypothetical protein